MVSMILSSEECLRRLRPCNGHVPPLSPQTHPSIRLRATWLAYAGAGLAREEAAGSATSSVLSPDPTSTSGGEGLEYTGYDISKMPLSPSKAICRMRPPVGGTPTAMYSNLGPHANAILTGSFVMLVIGQACMVFLIATLLFSKRVRKRTATLLNLLFVTLEISIPPALLFYAGQVFNPYPPFDLCYAQALLKHGSDPMFCVASLAMILEPLLEGQLLPAPASIKWNKRVRQYMLVALPYVVFAVVSIWAGVLGHMNHSLVMHQPDQFFCTISQPGFARGIIIFSTMIVMITIALEIYVIAKARRLWKGVPHLKPWNVFKLGLYIRIVAFTFLQSFLFVLFATEFVWNTVPAHIIPIVYEALMPLITFFIFSTASDTRAAWKWWGPRDEARGKPSPEEIIMQSLRHAESLRSSQGRGRTSRDTESIALEDRVIDISWANNYRV